MRTLFLISILLLASFAYSQKKEQEKSLDPLDPRAQLKSFFEMRKKLLESFPGSISNDDFFGDSFFEDFSSGLSIQSSATNFYESYWEENSNEKILVIKPQPNTALDINIKDQMVTISTKSEKHDEQNKVQSYSNMKSSFSLPADVDAKKAKIEQRGDEILVRLPLLLGNKPKQDTIKKDNNFNPIKPSPGDITI